MLLLVQLGGLLFGGRFFPQMCTFEFHRRCPEDALEICIDWAKATKGKGNFRAKLGIEKNSEYQKIIKETIKKCLIEYLEDTHAREYLTGKIERITKLENTPIELK